MFVTSPSLFLSRRFEDFFREDLGQLKWLWEFILASIWRKTRSVLRSRFSTALWVPFGTVFNALAPPGGTLLEAFSAHVAIQRRPEAEN